MTRTALVTGATGLLGRQVVIAFERAGWEVFGTGCTRSNPPQIRQLNLTETSAISPLLDELRPKVVVHCAANRFPDKCDADPDGTRALNVEATKALSQATSSRNILLIYISTDYVFSGKPGEAPYEVDAPTKPINFYGQTKLHGELAVLGETRKTHLGVILRVPILYGKAEKSEESAVNVLLDAVWKVQEKGVKIQMDDWAQRYPTNTEDVGRVCQDVATKYLEAADVQSRAELPFILQFSSEDRFTKYEICQLLGEVMGLSLDGIFANKTGNDPKAIVQRPYDTHLSSKILKDLGIPTWTQDFRAWWQVVSL